ncbi:DUF2721 domain-containing protein [Kiritimatiellota bacterium B12222]|nr:DUF2721 domain-containing protein [Kiritimatiellota bacterium B12222]
MLLSDLIDALQLSIGPVILISGVGLIILSMTNRFGRVVDRTRLLAREFQNATGDNKNHVLSELKILTVRVKLVRAGVLFASISVFLVSLIIISLFISEIFQLEIAAIIIGLYIACLLSLIISLSVFIYDTNLSLKAIWLNLPDEMK